MSVQSALRSGVGLVTAFAPASVAAALAAQAPEAMWIPWPETSEGTLEPKALPLLLKQAHRATAILIGPGMGSNKSTQELARSIIEQFDTPIIVDADALYPDVIKAISSRNAKLAPVILTPHQGEFLRIAKLEKQAITNKTLKEFCRKSKVITVLKGPYTRICDGTNILYHVRGGPVLARGGSGDLLAGLLGGIIAQNQLEIKTAIACSVSLHGQAAELLAQNKGQNCVHTTQLLDYLPDVLRARC